MITEDTSTYQEQGANEENFAQDNNVVDNQENIDEVEAGETPDFEAELLKEKDKFLRLFAEFENYKKRTAKERVELFKTAGQDVIQSLLPILDDFDRALVEISKSGDNDHLRGVEIIYNKFFNTLKSKGLDLVEVLPSDSFDSEIHEAITQIPAPSEEFKGKIIDVVEKGYKLGDKIIRYPKVVVGQ